MSRKPWMQNGRMRKYRAKASRLARKDAQFRKCDYCHVIGPGVLEAPPGRVGNACLACLRRRRG